MQSIKSFFSKIFNLFNPLKKNRKYKLILEICFHTEEKAYINLERSTDDKKKFSDILLISNYICRSLYNLDKEVSDSLSNVLGLFAADKIDILNQKLNDNNEKEPVLINDSNLEVQAMFAAGLVYRDNNKIGNFQLQVQGFDEHNINYFSFYSVILLFKYFIKKYDSSEEFINYMRKCSYLCSVAYKEDDLGPGKEGKVAAAIAMESTSSN